MALRAEISRESEPRPRRGFSLFTPRRRGEELLEEQGLPRPAAEDDGKELHDPEAVHPVEVRRGGGEGEGAARRRTTPPLPAGLQAPAEEVPADPLAAGFTLDGQPPEEGRRRGAGASWRTRSAPTVRPPVSAVRSRSRLASNSRSAVSTSRARFSAMGRSNSSWKTRSTSRAASTIPSGPCDRIVAGGAAATGVGFLHPLGMARRGRRERPPASARRAGAPSAAPAGSPRPGPGGSGACGRGGGTTPPRRGRGGRGATPRASRRPSRRSRASVRTS